MSVELTRDQQAVVDNEGGSLLVSAAAGSGKTRVLVGPPPPPGTGPGEGRCGRLPHHHLHPGRRRRAPGADRPELAARWLTAPGTGTSSAS